MRHHLADLLAQQRVALAGAVLQRHCAPLGDQPVDDLADRHPAAAPDRYGMPPARETTSGRDATANSARISDAVMSCGSRRVAVDVGGPAADPPGAVRRGTSRGLLPATDVCPSGATRGCATLRSPAAEGTTPVVARPRDPGACRCELSRGRAARRCAMSRRLANVTLDNLDDLPPPLPPVRVLGARPGRAPGARRGVRRHRAGEGGVGLGDAARVGFLRQDRVRRLDSRPATCCTHRPPTSPRGLAFPTSPVSADAVLLMTAARAAGVRRRRPRPDARAGRRQGPDPPGHQGDRGLRRRPVRRERRAASCRPTTCSRSASRRCARTTASRGCDWS